MPITLYYGIIVLFNKEYVASVKYLEPNWLAWVRDLLCARSRTQNHARKVNDSKKELLSRTSPILCRSSRDHYILPRPALNKKVLFMVVPKTYPAIL